MSALACSNWLPGKAIINTASGWKAVYDILRKDGFHVTMVQEPETSFAAAKRFFLDLQNGPTLLVGRSDGISTEAGVHPNSVGLVYLAAHAPDVGEDDGALVKQMPSVLANIPGAIKKTPDGYTYLNLPGQREVSNLPPRPLTPISMKTAHEVSEAENIIEFAQRSTLDIALSKTETEPPISLQQGGL